MSDFPTKKGSGLRGSADDGPVAPSDSKDVLGALSTELRTPLIVIIGSASSLQDNASHLDGGSQAQLLDGILGAANRLDRLLRTFSVVSRLGDGQLGVSAEPARLQRLLTRIERALGPRFDHVGLRLEPDRADMVRVDSSLIELAMTNMLEVMLGWTEPVRRLSFATSRKGEDIRMRTRLSLTPYWMDRMQVLQELTSSPNPLLDGADPASLTAYMLAAGHGIFDAHGEASRLCVRPETAEVELTVWMHAPADRAHGPGN